MKFTAKTKEILAAASFAAQGVKTKTTMPVLSHLLIEPDGDRLKITGTDMEVAVSRSCPADISEPDAFCIPAKKFVDLLASSSAETVCIELKDGRARITLDMVNASISFMVKEEFPALKPIEGESFSMLARDISKHLNRVSFAVDKAVIMELTYKSGIHVWFDEGTLRFTASDGRHLATSSVPMKGFGDFILPPSLVMVAAKISEQEDCEVTVVLNENKVLFRTENCSVSGKLIDSKYTNWKQVVPSEFKSKCTTNREALIRSLKRLLIFRGESQFYGAVLEFGKTLSVSSADAVHSCIEPLTAKFESPNSEYSLRLNLDHVLNILSRIESENATLEFNDDMSPAVIRDDGFMGLVMPLRI